MPNRAMDWFRQAEQDLRQAEDSARSERHEWACFAAQQGAEKAVKALHLYFGQEAWGHVISILLRDLPETVSIPEELIGQAKVLDNFYIPARYPNSHPEGPPFEHFGSLQSSTALEYADAIIEFVRTKMAG